MGLKAGDKIEVLEMVEVDDGADSEWYPATFQAFTRDEDGTPTVIYNNDDGFLKLMGLYAQRIRIKT